MSSPVQYSKYEWDSTSAVARYLTDRTVGGGPVTEVMINGEEIESPLLPAWRKLGERLVEAYVHEQGASWAGGFYVFRDVKEDPENSDNMWWDITLLTDPDAMDEDAFAVLNEMNQTTGELCCMGDGENRADGLDVKLFMTGLARVVVYTRDENGEGMKVVAVYEGGMRRGAIAHFGRMIRGEEVTGGPADSFIGFSDGHQTAAGRYVYYRDFELLYMGKKEGDYTEAPEDSFQFDTFQGNEGSEQALEESLAEQEAAVLAHVNAMGHAFGAVMVEDPSQWPKYNLSPNSGVGRYYASPALGGGVLAGEVSVGPVTIETPLFALWEELNEKLTWAYTKESGEFWAGGYYLLMDLQVSQEDPETFMDVALYTDVEAMSAAGVAMFAAKNYSGDYDMSNPDPADFTCCASDISD